LPIEQVPVTWDSTGYTSAAFDRCVSGPAFSGWTGDLPTEEEVRVIVELLKAQAGDSLLDVACGYGRHATVLASSHGLRVTGVDISPALITFARTRAAEQSLEVNYELRDARDPAWTNEFDHAMIVYNSFSLFSPDDAPRVLQGIHRALKPTGRLFLDLDNKSFNCRYGISDTSWYVGPGGLTLQEVYFHEDISVEVNRDLHFHADAEEVAEFIVFKRLYSQDEICGLLSCCGLRVGQVYGAWDLSPLSENSPKMILVAAKV